MTALRGLMTPCLGGFSTLRGYAPLATLAKISKADESFQRDLLLSHKKEIKAFLHNREDLFFPEIILSCLLEYDFNAPKAKSGVSPLLDIRSGGSFESNVNSIRAKSIKAGTFSPEAGPEVQMVEITIPDGLKAPMLRIDGNHRLSACTLESEFEDYITPFCILLFEPRGDNRHKKHQRIIFHNINGKSIPLTPEENRKVIIDDDVLFPDEELKSNPSFGWPYYLARKLKDKVSPELLSGLEPMLGDYVRATLVEVSDFLLEKKMIKRQQNSVKVMLESLNQINMALSAKAWVEHIACSSMLLPMMYYERYNKDGRTLDNFLRWVEKNHLYDLKEVDAKSMVRIFDKIMESKRRTIFVSMQFSDETKPNYEAIEAAVNDVNSQHDLDIKIENIRIDQFDKGYSYEINDEILRLIEESGLLIADLTKGNKNVYHEIGFLMGLNQGNRLPHENFILLHNGSIGVSKDDIGFNLSSIKQLRVQDTNTLREEIKKQIEIYYGLVGGTN